MELGKITENLYLAAKADREDTKTCHVYLLDFNELVLIDSGTGNNFETIVSNIRSLGFDPAAITTLVLTHCHVDHSAGALRFKEQFGCKLVMHTLDAEVVEQGDNHLTAGIWFKVPLAPTPIDLKLSGELNRLSFGEHTLHCLHTPGHSPGSLSLYTELAGKRVLFGQDIHAPILTEYKSNGAQWRRSMEKLLALKADMLCEGHLGIIEPAEKVTAFIDSFMRNQTQE